MEWEKILASSVVNGTIKEINLKKIPVLKTCNNWREVEPLGWVDHPMQHSHYKGMLAKLNGKIYFVPDKIITALSEFITWNLSLQIRVIKD
jgi:hypothetical protein